MDNSIVNAINQASLKNRLVSKSNHGIVHGKDKIMNLQRSVLLLISKFCFSSEYSSERR